ncbi:MFS transporter [Uliginosibacterium sp. 31-12]|uniref:MFS transporter n=1 Tax=Uliginosibacterium sp. 31-12 TaxID=3062781 RepID=UPI0026E2391B|nr:MFS transporter [Uliginosibacterium sp. 31-12]MDO6385771.1 MFS transporter [Uliginosibacterium sp. 31-12]
MKHPALPARQLLHARIATKAHFFICGLLFATWGVHVPTVKAQFGLNEAQLAWLMLAAGIGSLISLTRVGGWVARHGARPVVLCGASVVCASLAALLFAPGYALLMLLLFAFGLGSGGFDVAMNAEAVAVEREMGKPIMSSFHGFFSLGGLAGALIGSFVAGAGIRPVLHVALTCAAGFALVWFAARAMLPTHATHSPDEQHQGFRLPHGVLLLLGLLAALALVSEGAMYDWSTLYMSQELASPASIAALGYAAFSGAMAAGRFGGDWLRARLGASLTLQCSAWLAGAAMLMTLVIGERWAAIGGFALVGLGLSNVIPVLFSAAARVPGVSPASGIAGVSGIGYLGFMCGPPLIGAIAEHSSLSSGLLVVAFFAVLVALLTPHAMHGIARPDAARVPH